MNEVVKERKTSNKRHSFSVEVNIALIILRFVIGVMMLVHAIDKIENFTTIAENFPTPYGLNSWIALMLITSAEFICSILIIVGLVTRLAAVILMFGMVTAAFFTFPQFSLSQSELPMLYLLVYTTLFITGGGQYTIDRLVHKAYLKQKSGRA